MSTGLNIPEAAFWFVAITFNGVGSNLSCVTGADEIALDEMWEPLLGACGT